MKKNIIKVLLVIFIAVAGYILYKEYHFSASTVVPTKLSAEQILKEMPSIMFTEEDTAMIEELLKSEEINEAFLKASEDEIGYYAIPANTADLLLNNWIPSGFEVSELVITNRNTLYISFLNLDKQSISYSVHPDSDYHSKAIGVYGKDILGNLIVKAVYENNNGAIAKYKEKHLWFEWLKDDSLRMMFGF